MNNNAIFGRSIYIIVRVQLRLACESACIITRHSFVSQASHACIITRHCHSSHKRVCHIQTVPYSYPRLFFCAVTLSFDTSTQCRSCIFRSLVVAASPMSHEVAVAAAPSFKKVSLQMSGRHAGTYQLCPLHITYSRAKPSALDSGLSFVSGCRGGGQGCGY